MLHADSRFSDAVASKVAELERKTDAEVVVVAAERSGNYRDVAQAIASLAALLALAVMAALPWHVHPVFVVVDLALLWVVVSWAMGSHRLLAKLVSAARRREQVRISAAAAFHQEAVHATPRRTGLLVYVSAWEHHVELIPDVGLEARIPRGRWIAATDALTTDSLAAFLTGLDAVGALLGEFVPPTGQRRVALDDAPRIR